ncbi:MAG: LytTR family transcriptional regulator DNA-binding domain-containing protein, partial [Saprospiraceae bacterium]
IKTYADLLTPYNFYRIHQGHMVNLNSISRYINGEGGGVILATGQELTVSKRRKKGFREHLEISRSRSVIQN